MLFRSVSQSRYIGWGLYFTDLESIARNYANVLAGRDYTITLDELKINGKVIKNKEVLQLFKDAIEGFTNPYNTVSTNLYGMIADEEVAKKVGNGEYKVEYKITPNKTKNLYKVSLHKGKRHSEYTWLEWDKPFNQNKTLLIIQDEQNLSKETKFELSRIRLKESDEIGQKQALRQKISDYKELLKTKDGESYGYDNIMTHEIRIRFATTLEELQNILNYKGDFINFKNKTGSYIYQELIKKIGSDKGASLFLLESGLS